FVFDQSLLAVIAACVGNDSCGHQSRFDRRADALAAFRIREPRCVADDEHAVADHGSRRMRVQQVGVTFESRRRIGWHLALRLQPATERMDVFDQALVAFAPEPDVQKITLAEAPAVALQVVAEVQLGPVVLDATAQRLLVAHLELDFLRADRTLVLAEIRAEEPHDRAEVTASADHERCADLAVDEPTAVDLLHRLPRLAEPQSRARSLQQVVVELATADAVADDLLIVHRLRSALTHASDEAGDRLQHATLFVIARVDLQLLDDLRRYPARADLVARELALVEDQDVEAGATQLARARRARRSAADDQHVARVARRHLPLIFDRCWVDRCRPASTESGCCGPARIRPGTAAARRPRTPPASPADTTATCARSGRRTSSRPYRSSARTARATTRASWRNAAADSRRPAPRSCCSRRCPSFP